MSSPARSALVVYSAALVQGMGMVCFPASAAALKAAKGFSDADYGSIFLPLLVTTILSSLVGGALSRRIRYRTLLLVALAFNILSQLALAAVARLPAGQALHALFASTGLFGIAFGLAAGPLNSFPGLIFPAHKDAALQSLHTVIGAGLSVGPLLVGWFISRSAWHMLPWTLIAFDTAVLLATIATPLRFTALPGLDEARTGDENPLRSPVLWVCVTLGILYAFSEGSFANWSVIYLVEDRGIPAAVAAYALSCFWAAFAIGRLLISAMLLRVPAVVVWLVMPLLMVAAFMILPLVNSAATGIAAFSFAGFTCSAFFPLTVGMACARFPTRTALVSSLMTAGLMVGIGSGSYIIGPLRSVLPLERLYQVSAVYPLACFTLAAALAWSGRLKARASTSE